ncbi:MAG TPA: type II toxin-antitoxin system RelE/ParE family toxin [Terracidiphilus sp.]|nr:type II toxin-antitoxin system RelE/ParE family toxin [Terracidiphilus sp.]
MHRVVFSPEADSQLLSLYFHIATASSPEIAASYTEAIVKQCESLRMFPNRGTQRDEIRPGLRTFGFRRRVTIAFEVADEVVTILGIFYGGQNMEAAFDE